MDLSLYTIWNCVDFFFILLHYLGKKCVKKPKGGIKNRKSKTDKQYNGQYKMF